MSILYYILKDKTPVVVDPETYQEWFESSERQIADDTLPGDIRVSTVFLGLDHNYGGGEPLLFETMIFGGEHNGYCERYPNYDEAIEGHKKAVELNFEV